MARYFVEVAYKGTNYRGFQIQQNANSIQEEVEKAFQTLQKEKTSLTGSSRTDAGVHALQNFFHFDFDGEINPRFVYQMNAILPHDIVIKKVLRVKPEAHCRFDALNREYKYFVYRYKNPFLDDEAYYFPYKLNIELMSEAAEAIRKHTDFSSFSKRNTQVKTFNCQVQKSNWEWEDECLVFCIRADRFLRGMVRALVATMLKIGRGKLSLDDFEKIIKEKDCTKASFAVPARGLFLVAVTYPDAIFH